MTSNIGAKMISDNKASMGFAESDTHSKKNERIKEFVKDEVKKFFKPEFINRVDEMIIFTSLSESEIKEIARRMLGELSERCKTGNIEIEFDESVVGMIAENGIDSVYGARPLRRAVTSYIEDELTEKHLLGEIKSGDKLYCSWQDDKLNITKK
jgi:ATP-dependent Clp protease ATP-binding subunit ClpC